MRFLTLLNSGVTAESAAQSFTQELITQTQDLGTLNLETAADFINECFIAIGFRCNINADQLKQDDNFTWPGAWRLYTFNYNPLLFAPFEKFLLHFCNTIHERQITHDAVSSNDVPSSNQQYSIEDVECPLVWLMEILAFWCAAQRNLQEEVRRENFRRFEEPIARINFQLLCGMHPLRKAYNHKYILLDKICNRLYCNAIVGLFYEQTHNMIVNGLLDLFEDDYDLFYQNSPESLNVYYEILSTEMHKRSHLLVFKRLQLMLNKENTAPNKQLILTNHLIKSNMQQVYYTILKTEKLKNLIIEVLNFLNLLQSKLLSLDCFSQHFIEVILTHVLNSNENISDRATELCILMLRRKLPDELIFLHLLEFYLQRKRTPDQLVQYVKCLWEHFPYVYAVDEYLKIIQNDETNTSMRYLTAHMLVEVYKRLIDNFVEYQKQIEHILAALPEVFNKLKCNLTVGILLQIFSVTDLQLLKDSCSTYKTLLQQFEIYAAEKFIHSADMEFPLLLNLYIRLHIFVRFTRNPDSLRNCNARIYNDYEEISKSLQQADAEQKMPKTKVLHAYDNVLMKLSIVSLSECRTNYNSKHLFDSLKMQLLDSDKLEKYASKMNSFIVPNAIVIMTYCLRKMATESAELTEREVLTTNTKQFQLYLINYLQKLGRAQKKYLIHIEKIFSSLMTLYCTFNASSTVCHLQLTAQHYHLFVQTLLNVSFSPCTCDTTCGNEQMQHHSRRQLEYQKLMVRHFTLLHATPNISIPNNLSWKLGIYFGLSTHKLNDELSALLQIIARHHIQIYKHISGVIVYNLYKQQPHLTHQTILKAIKAHRTFIETQLPPESSTLLKVHIVLLVLEIINKSLEVLPINTQLNRLDALRHLHLFVEHLDLSALNALPDILQQSNQLRQYLLTANEQQTLSAFLTQFNAPV